MKLILAGRICSAFKTRLDLTLFFVWIVRSLRLNKIRIIGKMTSQIIQRAYMTFMRLSYTFLYWTQLDILAIFNVLVNKKTLIFSKSELSFLRSARLLSRHGSLFFSDIPRVQRSHQPATVMVWWVVSCKSVTPLYFYEKVRAKLCQENVIKGVVKQWRNTLFDREHWLFQ